MSDLTTATSVPPPQVILPEIQHRTFLGKLIAYVVDLRNSSHLARALVKASFTTNKTTPQIGDPAPPCDSFKARTYASYVDYCTMHGVKPRTLEYWDSLREQQDPTTTKKMPLLRTVEMVEFTFDALLVKGKVKRYLESLIDGAKPVRKGKRFFQTMLTALVGVRDTTSCNQKESYNKKPIPRVVTVEADNTPFIERKRCTICEQQINKITPRQRGRVQCGQNLSDEELKSLFNVGGEALGVVHQSSRIWDEEFCSKECRQVWLAQLPKLACETRPAEHPHQPYWVQPAMSPFLLRETKTGWRPLNVEKPINIDLTPGALKITPEWVKRNTLNLTDVVKASKKGKVLPHKSRWCGNCEEYVEQVHICRQPHAHLKRCKNATALKKSHQLLTADKQRREQNPLLRLAALKWTTATTHKAFWIESFTNLFSHMMRKMTSVADCIVVRNLSTINVVPQSKTYVGDYLARRENPRTCKHLNLRTFPFSKDAGGETIQMCPDCSVPFTSRTETLGKFDKERRDVLTKKNIDVPPSDVVRSWGELLDTLGLSIGRGFIPTVGDLNYVADQDDLKGDNAFSIGTRVNTVGCAGTDSDGVGKDRNRRDRRGKDMLRDQRELVTLTNSMCQYCGEQLWAKDGSHFCPDTDCRKRFQDGLPDLNEYLLKEAQHDTLFMALYLEINKNRKVTT